VVLLTGCGDDDGDDEAGGTTTTAPDTTAPADGGDAVEVTAVDFAFEGLPDSVAAGTTFSLVNAAEAELHELVAIRMPDDETRSLEELMADPSQLDAVFATAEPATVVIARPGETGEAVLGDGSIAEPGRYAVFCAIPTGVDPDEYLNAPPSEEGPPQVEGAGPPHFLSGMYAELTVE
jgi:hypothetical protein